MSSVGGKTPSPRRSNRRTAVISAVAAVVVILAGVGGFMWWQADQAEKERLAQEQWERDHATHVTHIALMANGYDENEATPIPTHVTGTDFEGNSYDRWFALTPTRNEVELMRGEYQVVVSSPVSRVGTIYTVSAPQPIVVTGDDPEDKKPDDGKSSSVSASAQSSDSTSASASSSTESSPSTEPSSESSSEQSSEQSLEPSTQPSSGPSENTQPDVPTFTLEPIPAEDVTDEQINQVREALGQIGYSEQEASAEADKVTQARQMRKDEIAAEERAAQAERNRATVESFLWEYFNQWEFADGRMMMHEDSRNSAIATYVQPGSQASGCNAIPGGALGYNAAANVQSVSVTPVDDSGTTFTGTVSAYFTQNTVDQKLWNQMTSRSPQEYTHTFTVGAEGLITNIT